MRRQSGFVIYAFLGLVLATGLAGGWAWVQGERLRVAKAELALCAAHLDESLALIEKQNEAVRGWKSASDLALKRAKKAEAEAKAAQKGIESERERLAALRKKPPVGACPAGEGIKRVREGLR